MWDQNSTPAPLKLSCITVDCKAGLHCFRQKKLGNAVTKAPEAATPESGQDVSEAHGPCYACGAALVDWDLAHERNHAAIPQKFEMMRREWIRHHFWHAEFTQKERNHALRKGRIGMRARVRVLITGAVGAASNYREGHQTPYSGELGFYGQHATATCCRMCVEYWHGIPPGQALSEAEINYMVELVMQYIQERLPELTENGVYVPPIRKKQIQRGTEVIDRH